MHLEALQESFLSDINVHLGYTCYFGGHIGFGITMTLPFQKRTFRPKISGIRGITQVSVLHWFKFKSKFIHGIISVNPLTVHMTRR